MIRFHLDESADGRLSLALIRRGIDVTTSDDHGLLGSTDREQLSFALGNGRVLITQDVDFLTLHHTGIDQLVSSITCQGIAHLASWYDTSAWFTIA